MEGIKYDEDKHEWTQLDFGFIQGMIEVLMLGAKKYCDRNWMKVEPWDKRYFNACLRHLIAWFQGERLDPETGKSHLAHAACCLMFLWWCDVVAKKERTIQ